MSWNDDGEMSFDDVFGLEDHQHRQHSSTPPPAESKTVGGEADSGAVSALTLKLGGMQIEESEGEEDDCLEEEPADLSSRWNQLRAAREVDGRMGTSAPVWIPQQRNVDWQEKRRLYQIREEENENKQTTFIPPHLTVERPLIQFSLNSGIAEKRAKLRAREKILTMLGVNESSEGYFTDTPYQFRPLPTNNTSLTTTTATKAAY